MKNFQTPEELFNAIINNSRVINSLPKELITLELLILCQKN